LDEAEWAVLSALCNSASLGELTARCDPARLGELLAGWLAEGLLGEAKRTGKGS
jgi:hypothetical protein